MTARTPQLRLRDISKAFSSRGMTLEGVSLDVPARSLFGLIGESGSGKSTLARIIAGLLRPDRGEVQVAGERLSTRLLHRHIQLVFQNPRGSLNPRHPVARALDAPLRSIRGMAASDRRRCIDDLLGEVRLGSHYATRYPHELSGGEAQRVAIARALAAEPQIVLLDEPTSALDVLVQKDILALLARLHRERGMTMMFISHDLAIVSEVCDRVAVLKAGHLVEHGPAGQVFARPRHTYTRALLQAAQAVGEPPEAG